MRDGMALACALQPVCALSSGGDDYAVCRDLLAIFALVVGDYDAGALVALDDDILAACGKHDLNAVLQQVLLNAQVQLVRHFSAKVAYRAVDQLKVGVYRLFAYLAYLVRFADALDMRVCAEFQIYLVGVVDGFLCELFADKFRQVSAYFARKRQLAVRKRARAGKTGGDVAIGLAVHADLCLCLGTGSLFNRNALFDDQYLLLGTLAEHFQRGEYSRGACADDNYVILCHL